MGAFNRLRYPDYCVCLLLALILPMGSAPGQESGVFEAEFNRLKDETSPYLQSHADNPINWFPWGEAAFQRAAQDDKLIFLSVGYSSCHWCHVMERESFRDPEIAAYLNQHFVCIKVDREERPDVDRVYMEALLLQNELRGRAPAGGWPMSMFLLPDGRPFFGASYLPARDGDRDGFVGFFTLLQRVHTLDQANRGDLERDAATITQALRQRLALSGAKPGTVDELDSLAVEAAANLEDRFDQEFGGFDASTRGPSPKFPQPPRLAFLLEWKQAGRASPSTLAFIDLTATQLLCSGIYDHVGGGWHRYTVDRSWQVPHFEKLLADNALLIRWFSRLYELDPDPLVKSTLEQTIAFWRREMRDPAGGFFSARDADSDGREGAYYVWTENELRLGLDEESFLVAQELFHWKKDDTAPVPEQWVLRLNPASVHRSDQDASARQTMLERLAGIRERLRLLRAGRNAPFVDYKILTAENGMMIRALADAGRVFQCSEYLQMARESARFLLEHAADPNGELHRTVTAGRSSGRAFLDDYAFLIDGLIALHEATGESDWLQQAVRLQTLQDQLFWDETSGAYFFSDSRDDSLISQIKDIADHVTPSGNSMSLTNLLYLSQNDEQAHWRERAEGLVNFAAPLIHEHPESAPSLLLGLVRLSQTSPSDRNSDRR